MTNEEKFVNELIGYIFAYPEDDYMTMECLCRKLHKHGLLDKKDGEWICDFIERAEQTEPQMGDAKPIPLSSRITKTEPNLSDIPTTSDCSWK